MKSSPSSSHIPWRRSILMASVVSGATVGLWATPAVANSSDVERHAQFGSGGAAVATVAIIAIVLVAVLVAYWTMRGRSHTDRGPVERQPNNQPPGSSTMDSGTGLTYGPGAGPGRGVSPRDEPPPKEL